LHSPPEGFYDGLRPSRTAARVELQLLQVLVVVADLKHMPEGSFAG